MRPGRRLFRIAGLAALILVNLPASPARAAVTVDGAGSTWSQIAVDQWRADVARQGLSINYQGLGSSTGRTFYIQAQSDFAVSEIPFQGASFDRDGHQLYDEISQAARRPYAYMPIVAGGTSFMYHLEVNGKRITDLKLSSPTIAKIFTGGITFWDDPAVTADDGRVFPHLAITPVVRSDGSGTSAQFTAYMARVTPDVWNPFCSNTTHLPAPCPPTSLYPYFGNSRAQQGSDGVANYVSAPYNNGAITYVEYGYALQRSFPVASVLNQGGYFVQPTAQNVSIALTAARINPDRTQVLDGVYSNPDPRAYPVSSYSYMIVPTSTVSPFSAEKGDVLGRFILYFLCAGQQKAVQLGYSPLPKNLVQYGFDAEKLIPGAPAPPPIDQCANPTITGAFITGNAPLPPASAKKGATAAARAGGARGLGTTSTGAGAGAAAGATGDTTQAGDAALGTDPTAAGSAALTAVPSVLAAGRDHVAVGLYVAAGIVVLLVIFLPPALGLYLRRDE
jgi:phosphate transport system substrate-binding protein